ncbi:unnamed protein product [Polarella glacialis]|uniref:HEAT repeat-containing protein 1 n=1 Tax=Polarella glacialis TaxID=89957 RepID=A0A813H0V9_POLGL|nr:unnamed protein product [Polarella glacialis]
MATEGRMADIERQALMILRHGIGKTSRQLAEEFASVELLTAEEFEPVARALVRSFDGSGEFSISLPRSGPIARELNRMFLQFSSGRDNRGLHFRRALLNECQNNYESLLQVVDSPTTCKAEAAQAWKRLAMIVTLIGHLYLIKLVARWAILSILIALIPPGDSQPAEIRVLCSSTLLKVVGHALADKDAGQMVAFIGRLVELTATSPLKLIRGVLWKSCKRYPHLLGS